MATIKTMKLPGHDEPMSAEYNDDELAQMRVLLAHAESLPRGSQERTDTLQDIFDIHYAKALFPGSTLSAEPPPEQDEPKDEAVPLFEFDPASPFAPPASVMEKLARRREQAGATAVAEPPPAETKPLATQAHARTGDPWTSKAAARSVTERDLRETQLAVLACFRKFGAMHHERLVEKYEGVYVSEGWPRQSVSGLRTRTAELVDAGFVKNAGRTVMLASSRHSIVWEVA